MSELYEFADPAVWGDDRLVEHYTRLQEVNKIKHNEPRATALARELAHIAFEFDMRAQDVSKSTGEGLVTV